MDSREQGNINIPIQQNNLIINNQTHNFQQEMHPQYHNQSLNQENLEPEEYDNTQSEEDSQLDGHERQGLLDLGNLEETSREQPHLEPQIEHDKQLPIQQNGKESPEIENYQHDQIEDKNNEEAQSIYRQRGQDQQSFRQHLFVQPSQDIDHSRPQTPLSQRSGSTLEPPANFHFNNSSDAIQGYESQTSLPSTPSIKRPRGPQQTIPDIIPSYFGQYQNRVQAPQQLPPSETSEIISEIIQDSDSSIAYPELAYDRRGSSSSTIGIPGGNSYASSVTAPESTIVGSRRGSSSTGSVYRHKDHVRKTSFVAGWDSDDDEEMDQARRGSEILIVNEKSPWLQSDVRKRKKVKTCTCLGVIVIFLICGVILGLVYREEIVTAIDGGKKHHHVDKAHDPGNPSGKVQSIEEKYHVNSTINPNPEFSNIFYGIDYTPTGSQEPHCGLNLGAVIEDIKVISQLTNRIRIYGMACHQAESVLKAIEYLNLPNMQIALTLWVDSNSTSWETQKRILWNLFENNVSMDTSSIGDLTPQSKKGPDFTLSKSIPRINGISIGNEVLFRNEDNSKPELHVPVSTLESYIDQIREGLALRAKEASASSDSNIMNLGKQLNKIPLFSSDLGRNAYQIVDSVDEVMSNIHPFFAQVQVDDAAEWAANNYKSETVAIADDKPAGISEVGWPSGPSSAKIGAAVPSKDNLQKFINDWVCLALKKKIPYYIFEAFDEPWKSSISAREAQWGIMTTERKLKITLPSC